MSAELASLRSLHGQSTRLWAGERVRVEPDRWVALTGARSVDYNVALCHGGGVGVLSRTREELLAARAPALMMVAGAALGEVQELVEGGWVCIGSVPFMARRLHHPPAAANGCTTLQGEGIEQARAVIAEAFALDEALAEVALPLDVADHEGRAVWAAFDPAGEIASCLVSVAVEDVVVIWSMATPSHRRRQGYAARVLDAALGHAAQRGGRLALLHSSTGGEAFYRSAGFYDLERWQLWSRPRWVLGRA